MASRRWLYFGGFVITTVLLVGVALIGLLDALSVLTAGASYGGEFVLLAMLGAAAEWIVAGLALALLAATFLAATVVSVLRSVSIPRDDRLASLVAWLERRYPPLGRLDVSEKVEPTTEDRKRRLKEQYVAGEIDEDALEREMGRVIDDASGSKPRSGTGTGTGARTGTGTAVETEDR